MEYDMDKWRIIFEIQKGYKMKNSVMRKKFIPVISVIGLSCIFCDHANSMQHVGTKLGHSYAHMGVNIQYKKMYSTIRHYTPIIGCQDEITKNKSLSKAMHVTWLPLLKTHIKIAKCKHSGEKDSDSVLRYMKLFDVFIEENEKSMPYRYDLYYPYNRGNIDYCLDTEYGFSGWRHKVLMKYVVKKKKSIVTSEILGALEHLDKVEIAFSKMKFLETDLTEYINSIGSDALMRRKSQE